MARRIPSAVAVRGRTIDFKQWTAIPGGSLNLSANGTSGGPGLLAFSIPATILRVRGHVHVAMLAGGLTATDEAEVVFGLGIFSSDAVALGSTALPDPSAEAEYPWMWYGEATMYSPNADFGDPRIQVHIPIDTKAMRKVKPAESLTMVAQYVNSSGIPGLRVIYSQLRVLIGT